MPENLTAEHFVERLNLLQSDEELAKIQRFFKSSPGEYGEGDIFIGVRMGHLFALAKEFITMPIGEIETLLESPIHEVRAGAMSIMDKQGRHKKTSESHRKALFDLYLRRHDRINNWDLVDLAAMHVVGRYLFEKARDPLYTLAQSGNLWERRTAIIATGYFIQQKDLEDTFKIAEMLLGDSEDLIHKPTGGFIRYAGQQDRARLLAFLDLHAATMPRVALRFALEHIAEPERSHYMNAAKSHGK